MGHHASSRRLCSLESLPGELIEIIFLEALEVDLARSSPYIARVVSYEGIYRTFLLQAFWNDPQHCGRDPYLHWNSVYRDTPSPKTDYGDHKLFQQLFGPTGYRPLRLKEQKRLQEGVSSCRWFTSERFAQILPSLLSLTLETVHFQRLFTGWHLPEQPSNQLWGWNRAQPTIPLIERPPHTLLDNQPKNLNVRDSLTIEAVYRDAAHGRPHIIRTVRLFCFPDKVLHGPWTESRVQLLVLLRRAFGRRFVWYDQSTWAASQRTLCPAFNKPMSLRGIRQAILERNETALRYLLDIVQTFSMDLKSLKYPPGLPAELYLTAMRQCPDQPLFLQLLLQVSYSSFPRQKIIQKWAARKLVKGDWLALVILAHLHEHAFRFTGQLEAFVRSTWRLGSRCQHDASQAISTRRPPNVTTQHSFFSVIQEDLWV